MDFNRVEQHMYNLILFNYVLRSPFKLGVLNEHAVTSRHQQKYFRNYLSLKWHVTEIC